MENEFLEACLDVRMKKVEPNVTLKLFRKVQISPPNAVSNILFQISPRDLQKALRILTKFWWSIIEKHHQYRDSEYHKKRKLAWHSILEIEWMIFKQKMNDIQPVSAQ